MEDSNISRNGHKVELPPTQALYRREQTNRVEMSEQTGRVDGRGIAVLESCLFECAPVGLGRNRECVRERQREERRRVEVVYQGNRRRFGMMGITVSLSFP